MQGTIDYLRSFGGWARSEKAAIAILWHILNKIASGEGKQMEGDVIVLQDLYRYRQTGFDDSGKALGVFDVCGCHW